MPLSAPVISAAMPANLPEPRYHFSPWSASGVISFSVPGGGCFWSGKGGLSPLSLGSLRVDGLLAIVSSGLFPRWARCRGANEVPSAPAGKVAGGGRIGMIRADWLYRPDEADAGDRTRGGPPHEGRGANH